MTKKIRKQLETIEHRIAGFELLRCEVWWGKVKSTLNY